MKKFISIVIAIILTAALGIAAYIVVTNQNGGSVEPSGIDSQNVVISEFLASNGGCLPDENGEYNDWIELYNPANTDISLFGYGLSDDKTTKPKWVFPGIQIKAGQYLVVFASGTDTADQSAAYPHANFKLDSDGGAIYLYDAAGAVIDSVKYEAQSPDISTGRSPENGEWQQFSAAAGTGPTPGYPNTAEGRSAFEQSRIAPGSQLLITEVMSSNKATLADNTGAYSDYIEIYNAGSEAVSLAGYGLSDDPLKTMEWKFPEYTLEAGKYLVVFASKMDAAATDAEAGFIHTNFGISSYHETIVLSNPQGLVLDQVTVSEIPSDNAYERVLANGVYGSEWAVLSQPTPGFSNDDAGYSQFEQSRPHSQ